MSFPIQIAETKTGYGTYSTIMLPTGIIETVLFRPDGTQTTINRSTAGALHQANVDLGETAEAVRVAKGQNR